MGDLGLILLARLGSAKYPVSHTPKCNPMSCSVFSACTLCSLSLPTSYLFPPSQTFPLVPVGDSVVNKLSHIFQLSTDHFLHLLAFPGTWLNSEDTDLPSRSLTLHESLCCFDQLWPHAVPSLPLPNPHLPRSLSTLPPSGSLPIPGSIVTSLFLNFIIAKDLLLNSTPFLSFPFRFILGPTFASLAQQCSNSRWIQMSPCSHLLQATELS